MDLFPPHEYLKWATYYNQRHDLICVPLTGKNLLATTDDCIWDHDVLKLPVDFQLIDIDLLKEQDWIDKTYKVAERYSHCLTGIGMLCSINQLLVVDFDDQDFYHHWKRVFKIDCPVSKTAKGYHTFFRCETTLRKSLITSYYDIQAWGLIVLPPSFYYVEQQNNREWVRMKNRIDRYRWIHEMDFPTIDLSEIGLVPSWFLNDGQIDQVVFLNKEPEDQVKFL